VTEFDRDNLLAKCYSELVDMLETQLEATKRENTVFDFTLQRIHAHKAIARFYVEGNARGGIKLWLGSWGGGSTSINVAYGSVASADNDNSLNDAIRCEVGADKRLRLAMLMGSRGDKAPSTAEEVFAAVWAKVAQQIVA